MLYSGVNFRGEYDFYEDVLNWKTYDEPLKDVLVDMAWDHYHDDFYGSEEDWRRVHKLAGDVFHASIELDGPTVVVEIYNNVEFVSVFDEFGSPDPDTVRDAYYLAKECGIYVSNNKGPQSVAVDNGEVVGAVFAGREFSRPNMEVWIDVCVAESHRRMGIGRALVTEMLEDVQNLAVEMGETIYFKAECVSGESIRLMQSLGMRRCEPYNKGKNIYKYTCGGD